VRDYGDAFYAERRAFPHFDGATMRAPPLTSTERFAAIIQQNSIDDSTPGSADCKLTIELAVVVFVVVVLAGVVATPLFTGLYGSNRIFDPHRPYQPSHLLRTT
jgi:hypothetical protein